MALIKCPECGKEISDQAKSCPGCGYIINNEPKQSKSKKKFIPILIGLCLVILIAVSSLFLLSMKKKGNPIIGEWEATGAIVNGRSTYTMQEISNAANQDISANLSVDDDSFSFDFGLFKDQGNWKIDDSDSSAYDLVGDEGTYFAKFNDDPNTLCLLIDKIMFVLNRKE